MSILFLSPSRPLAGTNLHGLGFAKFHFPRVVQTRLLLPDTQDPKITRHTARSNQDSDQAEIFPHTAPGSSSLSKQFPISFTACSLPATRACDRQNVYGAWPRVSSTTNVNQDQKGKKNTKREQVPWKYRAESQTRQFCIKKEKNKSEAPSRLTPWVHDYGTEGETVM